MGHPAKGVGSIFHESNVSGRLSGRVEARSSVGLSAVTHTLTILASRVFAF